MTTLYTTTVLCDYHAYGDLAPSCQAKQTVEAPEDTARAVLAAAGWTEDNGDLCPAHSQDPCSPPCGLRLGHVGPCTNATEPAAVQQ